MGRPKNPDLRGTGRTTRILVKAIEAAAEGRTVYVIGWTRAHCEHMMQMVLRLLGTGGLKHTVRPRRCEVSLTTGPGRIRFEVVHHSSWDWNQMALRGTLPRNTFVDHYTLEMRSYGTKT